MQKNVKIVHSPFNSAMDVVGGMLMTVFVPYSDKHVTVRIAPNVQDYRENLDIAWYFCFARSLSQHPPISPKL
jgi:hypothetical protein